jgi:hypothetical protein
MRVPPPQHVGSASQSYAKHHDSYLAIWITFLCTTLLLNSIHAFCYCYCYANVFDMFLAAMVQWPVVIPNIIIAWKIIIIKKWNKTISTNDTWDLENITCISDFLQRTVSKQSWWISAATKAQSDNLRRLENISVPLTPSGERVT